MANTRIPAIFMNAMNCEVFSIILFPDMLIMYASINKATPKTGTHKEFFSASKSCMVYDPNVLATKLSLIIIERAIKTEAADVRVVFPYAFIKIIAMPPAEGYALETLI